MTRYRCLYELSRDRIANRKGLGLRGVDTTPEKNSQPIIHILQDSRWNKVNMVVFEFTIVLSIRCIVSNRGKTPIMLRTQEHG